jgi:hypothetical protein
MSILYPIRFDIFSLDVNGNNSPNYNIRMSYKRITLNSDNGGDLAFKLNRRLCYSRRFDNATWCLGYASNGEFVIPRLQT